MWIDKGLIAFRGLDGPEVHLKLSLCFGKPIPHPVGRLNSGIKHAELTRIWYNQSDPDVFEVDGEELGGWLPWHFDLVYLSEVNRGGILRPLTLPRRGGETGFTDRIAAYDTLSEDLKRQIEGLSVVYKLHMNGEDQKFGRAKSVKHVSWSKNFADIVAREDRYPRVVHPLVYRQPETQRKVLNFSPWFSVEVEGMDKESGDRLLQKIGDHCVREEAAYYHRWQHGDMVLWDNWRMLHCCRGVPKDDSRLMERTTLAGDYGLGRFERATDRIDDSMKVSV